MGDLVDYIKDRIDINIDKDTIFTILDLEICYLEERGLIG